VWIINIRTSLSLSVMMTNMHSLRQPLSVKVEATCRVGLPCMYPTLAPLPLPWMNTSKISHSCISGINETNSLASLQLRSIGETRRQRRSLRHLLVLWHFWHYWTQWNTRKQSSEVTPRHTDHFSKTNPTNN